MLILILLSIPMITSGVLYSLQPNYTVIYHQTYQQLAHLIYEEKQFQLGWNYLHAYANARQTLIDQHKGVGFLQGYASYKQIYYAYNNVWRSILRTPVINSKAQHFIDIQTDYIDRMVDNFPMDIFWQYAGAYMTQLRYTYRGFLTRINQQNRLDMYISFSQFYYLTYNGDLSDVLKATSNEEIKIGSQIAQDNIMQKRNETQQNQKMNCNGYAKLQKDRSISVGHSTHNIYSLMVRIMKTYNFPTFNSRVGSQTITFSSRPGDLNSKDDFYVLSSGLKILETSFNNYNPNNYQDLIPKTVPKWLRVCIATNLARNGNEFIDYFLRERSGTHNNQWMVIDKKQLPTQKNTIQFIQQAYSLYKVIDMTQRLLNTGFIGSYNVPYSSEIYEKLKYSVYGIDYDNDPRAKILLNYNTKIIDVQTMKKWLITNQQQDPRAGLAPRYDLTNRPSAFGLTDCKIITQDTQNNNYIWAISGPSISNGRFPPFSWQIFPNSHYIGMNSTWNFTWVKFPIDAEKKAIKIENI